MYITSFHIDDFGVFSDITLENIPSGLSVFLGENEAGKSTCLEFLRATLAGYPSKNSAAWKPFVSFMPNSGVGGSLTLRLDNSAPGEYLRLTRRPGPKGGTLRLGDGAGKTLPPGYFDELLHGVTREMYSSVFGFSLTELQVFSSLNTPEVLNALYSAGFGPGLASPGKVLGELRKNMDSIFKPQGKNPPLNADLGELDATRRQLEDMRLQAGAYNDLSRELEEKKDTLAQIRRKMAGAEEEERGLARRLKVWEQWQARHVAVNRLENLETVTPDFPEDGSTRLAALEQTRANCERQLADGREQSARLRARLADMRINAALLEELPLLRRLAAQVGIYRDTLVRLPAQTAECRRAAASLKDELAYLGPGWTCRRIRATDRTLLAHGDIEKQARFMTAADSTHKAALDVLRKTNREVAAAEQAVEDARRILLGLPSPVASLSEEDRDRARRALAGLEINMRALPERKKNTLRLRAEFARSFEPLRLKEDERPPACLETILARRQATLNTACEVLDAERALEKCEDNVQLAKIQVQNLETRKKVAVQDLQGDPLGVTRKALDEKELFVNELRGKAATHEMELARLTELDERIAAEAPPSPVKSLPLMLLGVLLALLGVSMLVAHLKFGLTNFAFTENLVAPVSLWSGYLILVCGAAFIAGGLPRSGPEAKLHRQRMAQMGKTRETLAEHVADLEERVRQLCVALAIDDCDPVTLDGVALRLKNEREQIVLLERNRKIIDDLDRDIRAAKVGLTEAERARDQYMTVSVQPIRHRWQDVMLALGVRDVPSAEGAEAFLARVETAGVAWGALEEAEESATALEADTRAKEALLRSMPPVIEALGSEGDDAAGEFLVSTVQAVLEGCRAADEAREERIKAEAVLQGRESSLEDSRLRRDNAANELRQAEARLAEARGQWVDVLDRLGLDVSLEPDTACEAYKHMDKCLAAEERLTRAVDERKHSRGIERALRIPLEKLAEKLDLTPEQDGEGREDWAATLEITLNAAENAQAIAVERESLNARLAESRQAVGRQEAALSEVLGKLTALCDRAGAHDANDFLRLTRIRAERLELEKTIQQHEALLRLAAGNEPFEDFCASLAGTDQQDLEKRAADVQREQEDLRVVEAELGSTLAALDIRVKNLECADGLAILQQKEASLLESIGAKAREWARLALAGAILDEARARFQQARQPEVIRRASEIFSGITKRWSGISISLDDGSLSVLPEHGAPVSPETLSRGAQEQAYLSLRLAYISSHSARAEALPVIMDEVLVNFDPGRAKRTACAFVDLASGRFGKRHQIFYFTCQPHMADLLLASAPEAALFRVAEGTIRRN
ncbi:MAG: AAA family ATPase [Desulfovibrio sp.]|jgi:uncharacterized protein YhaN|nr:AAA family ATPase [Desulfovibrio sp.]